MWFQLFNQFQSYWQQEKKSSYFCTGDHWRIMSTFLAILFLGAWKQWCWWQNYVDDFLRLCQCCWRILVKQFFDEILCCWICMKFINMQKCFRQHTFSPTSLQPLIGHQYLKVFNNIIYSTGCSIIELLFIHRGVKFKEEVGSQTVHDSNGWL